MSSWSQMVRGALAGLIGLCVTVRAQGTETPAMSPGDGPASSTSASPASPLPGVISDKAFAAIMARDRRVVAALIAKPTANTLATAAPFARLAAYPADNSQSLALMARAVALAPDRPDLIWMQLSICGLGDCDSAPIEERLKLLDPDNGLAWMNELGRRYRTSDDPGVTSILAEMAAHSRFTLYTNQLAVMAFDALAVADPAMSIVNRTFNAWGLIAAQAIPPLQSLSRSCSFDALTIPGRRDACQALLGKLETSDALITQSIALHIQQRWWPEDSPEAVALREKLRQLH